MEALRFSAATHPPQPPPLLRHRHHKMQRTTTTTLAANPRRNPFIAATLSRPTETVPSPPSVSVPPPLRVSPDSLQYPPGYVGAVPDRSRSDGGGGGIISAMGYLTNILSSKVYDVAIESPLQLAPKLSERLGVNLWLKREDLQPVSSHFKF